MTGCRITNWLGKGGTLVDDIACLQSCSSLIQVIGYGNAGSVTWATKKRWLHSVSKAATHNHAPSPLQ